MSEALVIQSLKDKRAEIHGRITVYEAQIAQAGHDPAHVNATIRLFAEPEHQRAHYMVNHGFFKKGEIADICVRHLGVDGEMTTRELAERVMAERKLDASDRTLRNSVVFKVVQALRHARRRKLVRMVEKRKGMCVWAFGDAVTLRVVASSPSRSGCRAQQELCRSSGRRARRCPIRDDPPTRRRVPHRRQDADRRLCGAARRPCAGDGQSNSPPDWCGRRRGCRRRNG